MTRSRSITFAADIAILASVRDFATEAHHDLGGLWSRDDVELIVGELAANATIHAGGDGTLVLTRLPDDSLQIEVSDTDPTVPSIVTGESWDVEGHRGLFLIDALSQSWGVEPSPTGKRVWAILPVASHQGRSSDDRDAADGDAHASA